MSPRRLIVPAAGAAIALALTALPAAATDGNLYESPSSYWGAGGQFSATVLAGPVWQLQAPALSPSVVGDQWGMNWGCPPGSEIAAVRFGGLRTQAPSSLALRIANDGVLLWQEGDVSMPMSPAAGRSYSVPLPHGQCNVHLTLTQMETKHQHARGYFIDNPRVLWRDLAPPTVALRGLTPGWLGAGARLRVDWGVADNFGGDGVTGQSITVGERVLWSAAPGVGNHAVELALDGVPDGVHGVEVRADGDGTEAGAATGTVAVDRTPPSASELGAGGPPGPGSVAAHWVAADNLSGVATSTLEVNTAVDGGGGGSWIGVGPATGPGAQSVSVSASSAGIADGVHTWRVRATDVAGNVSYTPGPGALVVDSTAPRLDLHGVPATWIAAAELDVSATDNLEAALGPVPVEVDVNAAADGSAGGDWQRRGASGGPAGRRIVPLDLAGLASGRHLVRVTARNGGGLGAALATERLATLRVDRDKPVISRASFAGGDGDPLTVSWLADDQHAGVASAAVQWRDGGAWRTLGAEPASDGTGSMVLDLSVLPTGDRAIRLVVADGAGNTATRSGSVTAAMGGGVGSTASDPVERLRAARLTVTLARGRTVRVSGRTTWIRRITSGGSVTLRGRLTDRSGAGMVGHEVQARGYRGRLAGRALTRRDGTFTLVARPAAGGPLRVGVQVQGHLLPDRPAADVRVEVRPRVALAASGTTVLTGERILFSGRLTPAPGALDLGGRKSVVLEWLDPIRRSWRPVVNARIRPDGTFAIPWAFGLRGLTIPMRVTVPGEVGWPLLPVRSGVIRVKVS